MKPKQTKKYGEFEIKFYDINEYRQMDLYERSLSQYKKKQAIQVINNEIWRKRKEILRLNQDIAKIERTKEDEFIAEGHKRVLALEDEDANQDSIQ